MTDKPKPTHFNQAGEARMVDVGDKPAAARTAIAEGFITMHADTLAMLRAATNKKGDVLAVARIAGILAAKRTAELVPLCHPIMLTKISVDLTPTDTATPGIHCTATAATVERTGVEMEALCAVQTALLTVYDMCKATDRAMEINNVRLVHKSGGKSGEWNRG